VKLRYCPNQETDEPHIYDHDVSEEEVEAILRRPGSDARAREGSRVAVGQTAAGRYLKVIYLPEADGVFVITAYELTKKALAAYRRNRKKKQQ